MNINFKAIIFDLGGVILNIDYHKTSNAFKALGVNNFDALYSQAKQNQIFNNIETGKISPDEFRTYLKRQIKIPINDYQIDTAWNAMLLDLPKPRVNLLRQLRNRYPIFLYSNTNAIHLQAFQNIIKQSYGKAGLLEDLFVKTYYSHELGMRKPNRKGFEYILHQNGLTAEKTLFIDDSAQHIEGAKSVGLKTYHLVHEDITEIFDKI